MLEERRGVVGAGAGLEVPEALPVPRVVRLELAVRAPEEYEVPLGRARPRVAGLRERLLPDPAPAERVDRGEGSRRRGVRGACKQCGDVVLPSLVLDAGDRHLPRRLHGRADVEVVRLGVVADRVPVHSALRARHDRDELAEAGRRVDLLRRHDLEPLHLRRERLLDPRDLALRNRPVRDELAVARDGLRRCRVLLRILRHRLLVDPVERLPGLAVEHVDPAGLSGLRDALAPVGGVEEDGGARGVVVPDVVVHLLEPPPELARLRLDGDDRRRPFVVALPDASVPVRPRVPGREVEEAEVGVVGRRLPDRAAAVQVRVAGRPRVSAGLARRRDGVVAPDRLAVVRVERLEETTRAEVGSDDADVHAPVRVDRGRSDHLPVLPADELPVPDDFAGLRVERDDLAVELSLVHLSVADRDAAVQPTAADRVDLLVEVPLVLPEDLAGLDVDGEDVVLAGRDVDHAVVDDRLALARVLRLGPRTPQIGLPDALELLHVRRVDLVERRVPVVREGAARRRPVVARRLGEITCVEGRHVVALPSERAARHERKSNHRECERDQAGGGLRRHSTSRSHRPRRRNDPYG